MHPPPFLPAPPLGSAVVELLGPTPTACLVAGSKVVARALAKAGHPVTRWQILTETRGSTPPVGTDGDVATASMDIEAADDAPPLALHVGSLQTPPPAMDRYGALVLSGVLTGIHEPGPILANLSSRLPSKAWVVVVEPAAWGRSGRLIGKILGKLRGRSLLADPSTLASLCLASGLTDLRQRWPQGLRSLVLTAGRVSPLQSLREP